MSLHVAANICASAGLPVSRLFWTLSSVMPSYVYVCVCFVWNKVIFIYGMLEIFWLSADILEQGYGTDELCRHSGPFHTFSEIWGVKATMSLEKVKPHARAR